MKTNKTLSEFVNEAKTDASIFSKFHRGWTSVSTAVSNDFDAMFIDMAVDLAKQTKNFKPTELRYSYEGGAVYRTKMVLTDGKSEFELSVRFTNNNGWYLAQLSKHEDDGSLSTLDSRKVNSRDTEDLGWGSARPIPKYRVLDPRDDNYNDSLRRFFDLFDGKLSKVK